MPSLSFRNAPSQRAATTRTLDDVVISYRHEPMASAALSWKRDCRSTATLNGSGIRSGVGRQLPALQEDAEAFLPHEADKVEASRSRTPDESVCSLQRVHRSPIEMSCMSDLTAAKP